MMNDFTSYLQARNLAERSIETYLEYLENFFSWLDESGLSSEQVAYVNLLDYVKKLREKGQKGRSINGQLGAVRHWFSYLRQTGKIQDNPADGLYVRDTNSRLPHDLLSSQELLDIYQNYEPTTPKRFRNRQLLGLLVFQGLRTAEVERLHKSDIDLENRLVRVLGSRKAEGRLLELHTNQISELRQYLEGIKTGELLFKTSTGGNPRWVITPLLYQLKKQNLIKSTHQLRASVIANWLKKQGLRQVQYLAGHRYASSTERYLVAYPEKLKKAILATHPLDF